MASWPWNLVYFYWLSKDYLVFRLRLSISGRCSQLNILGKKFLGDLDLELWPWLKNQYFFLHTYLCPIHHLQFGLSKQKGKVSKVSEKFLHKLTKIDKKCSFCAMTRVTLLRFKKLFQIWILDIKTFSTSYYTTTFDDIDFQGHFKVRWTLTLVTSRPWNIVYFYWLSMGYLVLELQLSTSNTHRRHNFLEKSFSVTLTLNYDLDQKMNIFPYTPSYAQCTMCNLNYLH